MVTYKFCHGNFWDYTENCSVLLSTTTKLPPAKTAQPNADGPSASPAAAPGMALGCTYSPGKYTHH